MISHDAYSSTLFTYLQLQTFDKEMNNMDKKYMHTVLGLFRSYFTTADYANNLSWSRNPYNGQRTSIWRGFVSGNFVGYFKRCIRKHPSDINRNVNECLLSSRSSDKVSRSLS